MPTGISKKFGKDWNWMKHIGSLSVLLMLTYRLKAQLKTSRRLV